MRILGISEFDNDASAALLVNGRIIAAAQEERFVRIKQYAGFPHKAIEWILEYAKLDINDIDLIAIAKQPADVEIGHYTGALNRFHWFSYDAPMHRKLLDIGIWYGRNVPRYNWYVHKQEKEIKEWLEKNNIPSNKVHYTNHHRGHAATAYYFSGFEDALVITCDGQGHGETVTVYEGSNGKLNKLHSVALPNSMGFFYSSITKAAGFKPNRHEGKITGLAAYAPPHPESDKLCQSIAFFKDGSIHTPYIYGAYPEIKMLLKKLGREALAASFQKRLEEVIVAYIKYYLKKYPNKKIALAGGVFANVKLNQRIAEIAGVQEIFVFPGMADVGLSVGAAILQEPKMQRLDNVYFGPSYSDEFIRSELEKHGLEYGKPANIAKTVGERLANGRVVGLFNGRMEFGPRALGNRTIMYETVDPKVNDWLNDALERCYDDKTEILTKDGWKLIKDIPKDEIVATLNADKNSLEYQKIQDKIEYAFEGEMYYVRNNRLDLLVTPNHNLFLKKKHSNKFRLLKIEDAYKIKTYHYQKTGGITWEGKKTTEHFIIPPIITKDGERKPALEIALDLWLEFFGYWIAEGWLHDDKKGHYKVCIAQEKKSKYFDDMKNCMAKMPFKHNFNKKNTFSIYNKQLYTYLKQFGKANQKYIPNEILELRNDKLRILFDALIKGDGNIRGSGFRYATTSKKLADDMQILAIKLGYSARISVQKPRKIQHSLLYMVRIGRSSVATVRKSQMKKKFYVGMVYCVTVPNHIILVRRNGRPVFCGNSEFMPFAPVTLKEHAEKCYIGIEKGEYAAKFMTMTFDCTPFMKKKSPAVVHVDGTARPQLIDRKTNSLYYDILKNYYKLTGIPSTVNTSFNMHEEPIICSPYDAIRAYKLGRLDALAIGSYLVENENGITAKKRNK